MLNREILSGEHAELESLAVRLLEHIAGQGPGPGLSALRWRLNHVLMVHLAKEDKLLYPAMVSSEVAGTRTVASRFAAEMGGLSGAYLAYASAWTQARIEADWAGFCGATRAVIRLLRQRIEREERDLYPRYAPA